MKMTVDGNFSRKKVNKLNEKDQNDSQEFDLK